MLKVWRTETREKKKNKRDVQLHARRNFENGKTTKREKYTIAQAESNKYVAEFIRKDGEYYEPSSLRCLVSAYKFYVTVILYLFLNSSFLRKRRAYYQRAYNKHNIAWKVCLYGIYVLVDLNQTYQLFDYLILTNSCVNTVRANFPLSILYMPCRLKCIQSEISGLVRHGLNVQRKKSDFILFFLLFCKMKRGEDKSTSQC